jgi:hypothetical protein
MDRLLGFLHDAGVLKTVLGGFVGGIMGISSILVWKAGVDNQLDTLQQTKASIVETRSDQAATLQWREDVNGRLDRMTIMLNAIQQEMNDKQDKK